jgi:hypothetical protein
VKRLSAISKSAIISPEAVRSARRQRLAMGAAPKEASSDLAERAQSRPHDRMTLYR